MLKNLFKKTAAPKLERHYLILTPDPGFTPVAGRWGQTFDQVGAFAEKLSDWAIENGYFDTGNITMIGHHPSIAPDHHPAAIVECLPAVIEDIRAVFPVIAEIRKAAPLGRRSFFGYKFGA